MKRIYYIFIALLIIIISVEFRVCEEDILKRLWRIIDKIEKEKELI